MMAAVAPDNVNRHDVPPSLLEKGWRKCYSANQDRPYYYNFNTAESHWSTPTTSTQGSQSPWQPPPAPTPSPDSQEVMATPLLFSSQSSQSQSTQATQGSGGTSPIFPPSVMTPPPCIDLTSQSQKDAVTQTGEKEFRFVLKEDENGSHLVVVKQFRGKTYIGIREYFRKNGQMIPTKKGLNLTVNEWVTLKSQIQNIEHAVQRITK